MIRAGFVLGLFAALTLGGVSTVAAHGDDNEPEVKVSRLVNGRCGPLEGSLPTLFTRNGIRPGEVAGDVTVCVANTGDADATLSLRADELVELDPLCTDSEAAADATCGRGQQGELGRSLLQQVGLGSCPATAGATDPRLERRLTALAAGTLVLVDRLRKEQLVCVRLRLRYEPADAAAAVASQSDRTFWRYAFTATERH